MVKFYTNVSASFIPGLKNHLTCEFLKLVEFLYKWATFYKNYLDKIKTVFYNSNRFKEEVDAYAEDDTDS